MFGHAVDLTFSIFSNDQGSRKAIYQCLGVDWHAVAAALAGADLRLVALAAALNFVHVAAKSERWRVMLSPVARVSTLKLYFYLIVSYAASVVLPGRAGEALRVYLLRRHDVPAYASALRAFLSPG